MKNSVTTLAKTAPVKEKAAERPLLEGVKSGTVLALGYIPIAIAFGLLAKASGIAWWVTATMSLAIFAGASQFVGINMMTLGAAAWEIVMTTFILNLRHFLMTTALSQRIEAGTPRRILSLIAFGVTDETFSVASLRKDEQLKAKFLLGLNLIAYTAWNVGTWIGMALGSSLPAALKSSMGISLYAMFIGLLIPSFRTFRPAIAVAAISMATASVLHWVPPFTGLSPGWVIIISTVLASTVGAFLYPAAKDETAQ
jgi:4-azaleucine resistance transporter AzlC